MISPLSKDNYSFPSTYSVPDEVLLKIFTLVILQLNQNITKQVVNLRLVSHQWRHVIDYPRIGQLVFDRLNWTFPEKPPAIWQDLYRLYAGDFLLKGNPSKTIISYPLNLDLKSKRIVWIENLGFIAYEPMGHEVKICMFNCPMQLRTISFSESICAILVIKDHILCGMKDGRIEGYSWKNSEMTYKSNLHQEPIIDLFAYQGGWISICAKKIVHGNLADEPTVLLSEYNPHSCNLNFPLNRCFLAHHYLFFEYGDPESLIGGMYRYCLSLERPLLPLQKILNPRFIHSVLNPNHVWGDEMSSIQEELSTISNKYQHISKISRFPFQPELFFRGEPGRIPYKEISWGHLKDWSTSYPQSFFLFGTRFFFRKKAALVIQYDYDSKQSFSIQLVELEMKKKVIFQEREYDIDVEKMTLFNHQFLYIKPNAHEVIILSFPQ